VPPATAPPATRRYQPLRPTSIAPSTTRPDHRRPTPLFLVIPMSMRCLPASTRTRLPLLPLLPLRPVCANHVAAPYLVAPWRPTRYTSSLVPSRPTIAALLSQSIRAPDTALYIHGFVRSVRQQKRIAFAVLGDGSSLQSIQAVMTPEQAKGSVSHIIE
jgi:hypothetical protein